ARCVGSPPAFRSGVAAFLSDKIYNGRDLGRKVSRIRCERFRDKVGASGRMTHEHMILGSAGCEPALFGRLPTNAGWQPALPELGIVSLARCDALQSTNLAMPKAKTKTANIRAIVGSDEARVKREAAELAQKLAPAEAGEFGLEIIDGAVDNVDGAAHAIRSTIAALLTLPFFGGG